MDRPEKMVLTQIKLLFLSLGRVCGAKQLVLQTENHQVPGSNQAGGRIHLMTVWCFKCCTNFIITFSGYLYDLI